MVKAYLRYEPAAAFGVIVSVESNITYDSSGKHLLAPALEKVGVWHIRQGVCTKTLAPSPASRGPSLAVTSIASSTSSLIASGYADGSVRIWDSEKGTCETTLNGHKGAVTALRYNKLGSLLASGSKDNDIILWDVVGETGLYRLRGHRDQVTDLVFLDSGKKLVSSSKDKFLRVWDLETQHCMQIVSGHHSEIWSIDIDPEERFLVSGSADVELRFYTIKRGLVDGQPVSTIKGAENVNNGDSTTQNKWEVLKHFGEIQRQSKDRVSTVAFNKSGNLLACQVAGKTVEIFRILDEAKAKHKAKRRLNRKKEKKSAKGEAEVMENGDTNHGTGEEGNALLVTAPDVFKLLHTVRASKKICSISFCPITPKNLLATLALSLNNNMLEFYSIENSGTTKTLAIELQGHRSDVRSVTLSSDNSLLMSTSHNAVKIWNPSTGSCLRTIDSGYGLCGLIIPDNKYARVETKGGYALVGTKDGTLEIIDIGSGTCLEVVEAHGGSVRSIAAIPNENSFVTGSADHDVKFWEYEVKQKSGQGTKCLTVSNVRTMKMNDDVLVVAVSPDAKYIAVALLDCTVKVFFADSLKFFLSLYGHKLPVLCMAISSDGDLIVTGSADKNLKIWGLDFGDCHKSIFAHADSVMAVQFVHNTHYMFSVGKDRLVKYWDADKFELLLTLEGHHADVWCLAISNRGDFIVTGSHDRSIRRWDRTEEPFFIEEEKEKRLEEMFESDLDNAFENRYVPKEEVPEEGAVALAGKKTQETVTATDLIIDALDIAEVELNRIAEHQADDKACVFHNDLIIWTGEEKTRGKAAEFQPNAIMLGLSPSDYVLRALSNVNTNDLEQTLLALPFPDALKIMSYLKDWTSNPDKYSILSIVKFLLSPRHEDKLLDYPVTSSSGWGQLPGKGKRDHTCFSRPVWTYSTYGRAVWGQSVPIGTGATTPDAIARNRTFCCCSLIASFGPSLLAVSWNGLTDKTTVVVPNSPKRQLWEGYLLDHQFWKIPPSQSDLDGGYWVVFQVELVCRIATVLLQTHHHQLVTTPAARPMLTVLKDILYARIKACKDTLGFNLAAMDHLKQLMASRSDALFRDAKSKLLEIRAQHSKRLDARLETREEKRKKKKQKKSSDGHAWT
uniref:Small-subunit processome Utp12 domain-containing protein n=1 Tax=Quercus lobata TaxID=97700 RepID=A0A7N2M7D1_QUELO